MFPRLRILRPRFSLLTLVLGVLFVGACGGLWFRWEPWVCEVVLQETDGEIPYGTFSSDGKRLLTAGKDGTVHLWDAWTGQLRVVFEGRGPLYCLMFSPDEQQILTTYGDGTARVWDATTGKERAVLKGRLLPAFYAKFAFGGKEIMTAGLDGPVLEWDLKTRTLSGSSCSSRDWLTQSDALSPDGREIAEILPDQTVHVREVETGEERVVLSGHLGVVHSAAFSPDGKQIVTASEDATARVWDAESGQERVVLTGHEKAVCRAAFSPDGQQIVTTSEDRTVRVWNVKSGQECIAFRELGLPLYVARFLANGRRVVTQGEDGVTRLWDTETGQELVTPYGRVPGTGDYVSCSPDGRRFLVPGEALRLFDAETGEECAAFGDMPFCGVSDFSPDGRRFLAWSDDKTVRLWDTETVREDAALRGHTDGIKDADFSPDGRWIFTCSYDRTVRLWASDTGKQHVVLHHAGAAGLVCFSPDGRWIVTEAPREDPAPNTTNYPCDTYIWNIATGEKVYLRDEQQFISTDFSPDSHRMVSVDGQYEVRLWDTATWSELSAIGPPALEGKYAYFSPDGHRLAIVSRDGTTRLYSRRRPESWWGIAWLPESWIALLSGSALLFIAVRNIRRRSSKSPTAPSQQSQTLSLPKGQ